MPKLHAFCRYGLLLSALQTTGCAGLSHALQADTPTAHFANAVLEDYRLHYSAAGLLRLGLPLAVNGALANTEADTELREFWQTRGRTETADDVTRIFLRAGDLGQNKISLPLYTLTLLAADYRGNPRNDNRIATWAARSARANLLGGPQAWALTYALGTHRPGHGESDWRPWNDNDGVSGHAFYGAVPFLTAARMSQSPGWRYSLYALSVLPAYSRVYNDQHYTSQVIMGWSLAWLATGTVAATDRTAGTKDAGDWTLHAAPLPGGGLLVLETAW